LVRSGNATSACSQSRHQPASAAQGDDAFRNVFELVAPPPATPLRPSRSSPGLGAGTGWAILSAAMAIGALIALYVALNSGEASTIIPLSAAYPAVTLVLAAVFLSEAVTAAKAGGAALVLAGVVLLTSGN
jgi:drug/metabolite transporter (DMT)-like permease